MMSVSDIDSLYSNLGDSTLVLSGGRVPLPNTLLWIIV